MRADRYVAALEAGSPLAGPWPAEVAHAFFARVAELMGQDPVACRRLAAQWARVARHTGNRALPLRAIAAAEWSAGRHASAARLFKEAGEAATDPVDRLAFRVGEVDSLARLGRVPEAVRLASRLAAGLVKAGREDLAARAQLNAANALLWEDRHSEARSRLLWAIPRLEAAGLGRDAASAILGLSTACLHAGRPEEAREHATNAVALFTELEMEHFSSLARLNLAHLDLLQGRHDSALETLLEVQTNLGADAPANDRGRLQEFLGDAYLALNLLDEAREAYRTAQTLSRAVPPLNRANVQFGRAGVHAAANELESAARVFAAAAKAYNRCSNPLWESAAWTGASRVAHRQGRRSAAIRYAARALERLPRSPSPQRFEALLALAEASQNSALAREALTVAQKGCLAGREWAAHALRARLGKAPSLRHHRRAFRSILESRLLQRTDLGRLSFLDDKQSALESYLGALLANPTPEGVTEALEAVRETRAAALLDEIGAQVGSLTDTQQAEFEALRRSLASRESLRPDGNPTRRAAPSLAEGAMRRRWHELCRRAVHESTPGSSSSNALVFVQVEDALYALRDQRAIRLRLGASDVADCLRWLHFDLLAPTVVRTVDAGPTLAGLRRLAEVLAPALEGLPEDSSICPDGVLWQVPWTALLPANPPTLALRATTPRPRAEAGANVVLWAAPSADLPHAMQEIEALQRRFPQAMVCRTAQEARASLLRHIDLLHVAAHARLEPAAPAFSSILFPDGPLFATEIARSPGTIGEAVLSACETARLTTSSRQEPSGIARAFLARGAHAVIGNAWPLDDEAATLAVDVMHAARSKGHPWPEALARACAIAREAWPHPYFWGGWTLFGGC